MLGLALIGAGFLVLVAALSRRRYVQEADRGFAVLNHRGGGFVFGSALLFCVAGVLVAVVVLLE